MTYDPSNVFAKILRHEIPCKKIYEDDQVLAFYDINPKAKIHALVVTKGPYQNFQELMASGTPQQIQGFLMGIISTVKVLHLDTNGYRIVMNTGKNSGQEVPHLHAHILGGEPLTVDQL